MNTSNKSQLSTSSNALNRSASNSSLGSKKQTSLQSFLSKSSNASSSPSPAPSSSSPDNANENGPATRPHPALHKLGASKKPTNSSISPLDAVRSPYGPATMMKKSSSISSSSSNKTPRNKDDNNDDHNDNNMDIDNNEERPRKRLIKSSYFADSSNPPSPPTRTSSNDGLSSSSALTSPAPGSSPDPITSPINETALPSSSSSSSTTATTTNKVRSHLDQFRFNSNRNSAQNSRSSSPLSANNETKPTSTRTDINLIDSSSSAPSTPQISKSSSNKQKDKVVIDDDEEDSPIKPRPNRQRPVPHSLISPQSQSQSQSHSQSPSQRPVPIDLSRNPHKKSLYMRNAYSIQRTNFPHLHVDTILKELCKLNGNVNNTISSLRLAAASPTKQTKQQQQQSNSSTPVKILSSASGSAPSSPVIISASSPVQKSPVKSSPPVPPARRKLKKRVIKISDDESEESFQSDDDDEDDESDNNDYEQEDLKEQNALEFFNTCDASELPGVTACTPKQAELIVALRPFADVADLKSKLRKQKGVSNTAFDSYLSIVNGYEAVDRVFKDCQTQTQQISDIMQFWSSSSNNNNTNKDSSANGIEDGDSNTDTGVHATLLPQLGEQEKQAALLKPHIKKASESFIYQQPALMSESVKLKDYQLFGLNWLYLLYSRNTSGILADEMGLGKTVQVISLFAHLKQMKKPGPHLVIVPSSTLENWMREFETFAPSLNVQSYYGQKNERADLRMDLKSMDNLDVVVTTYVTATSTHDDRRFLRKMQFKTCVYDEGHQLKNNQSKKYRDLMEIRVNWRLLLTGTPLQNNLQELVSLLSFILPNLFNETMESLRAIFKVPPEAKSGLLAQKRIYAAKQVMTPFVLRRKKIQVLQDLPDKFERIEYCDTSPLQQELYTQTLLGSKKAILEKSQDELEQNSKAKEKDKSSNATNVLMNLRKAANHPMLFRRLYTDKIIKSMARDCLREVEFMDRNMDYIYEDMEVMSDFELHRLATQYKNLNKYACKNEEWMQAGKIDVLQKLLPDLKAKGHRILLFSQFTQILDILEQCLQTMNLKHLRLTGQTPVNERQGLIDVFTQNTEISVFLLSTRAGGLGLNLVAADTVIIFDQDFNPHNDRQAADRAWRIGQTKNVNVIKLVTRNTIDEDILDMAITKMKLDETVSRKENEPAEEDDGIISVEETINEEPQEGQETGLEKKVKNSLLSNLRKKFEEDEQQKEQQQHQSQSSPSKP